MPIVGTCSLPFAREGHAGVVYVALMAEARTWTIEFELREDAMSIFVPVETMPAALVGDLVVIESSHLGTRHTGHVADLAHDASRGDAFVVEID